MQRRNFLQATGVLAVGALLPTRASGCQKKNHLEQIGLQLYTLRDAMLRDADETLRQVAAIGYNYVEGASYNNGQLYGRSAKIFKALLASHNLQMPSGHVDWDALQAEPERAAATCREAGQTYLVLPFWPEEKRTAEGYRELVEILNNSGEVCRNYGLQLAYHNHDFEFNKMVAGQRPFDFLVQEVDPATVQFELDLYWITRAGSDYQKYFRELGGRFPLWHVKDIDNTPDKFFASVGSGVLDWPAIFSHQAEAGMKYFFVEQDQTRPGGNPMEEIAASYTYLKQLKY